jgi:hypothetical protein
LTSPHDFALRESESPPAPGGPFNYAITGKEPDWYIQAWNIPAGRLPPFIEEKKGLNTVFSSSAPEAGVTIVRTPDTRMSYRLSQNGAVLPCERQGEPLESNLLAGPVSLRSGSQDRKNSTFPHKNVTQISQLANLVASATLKVGFGAATTRKGCAVSQAAALISVVLNNRIAHQTLFYQVALYLGCGPQPANRQALCERLRRVPRASYYFSTNPFGVADVLPLFGQKWLADNERRAVRLDLLPHILQLIDTGPATMDRDPSHWTVDGYYNGQHIWGDVIMWSEWEDVDLVATRY